MVRLARVIEESMIMLHDTSFLDEESKRRFLNKKEIKSATTEAVDSFVYHLCMKCSILFWFVFFFESTPIACLTFIEESIICYKSIRRGANNHV